MCIINHDCSGRFFNSIICRYGDITVGVGILVILPGYAYVLCMSVRSPPLAGVYGNLCCIHLVSACVLLNISLYCGNKFCIYFVDFVAVNLVSCMVIIAGLFGGFVMSWWRFGRAVFNAEAFHVIICVLWFVVWIVCGLGVGVLGNGGGWEYSCKGSVHLKDSMSSSFGKKGNLSVNICVVSGALLCWMKAYSSLWMVLGGLMIFWLVCTNWVYGCSVVMCRSGGFGSKARFFRTNVVQSGSGFCANIWLHVSIAGLIVIISAYSIRGGGWCWFLWMYRDRYGYLSLAS